MTTMQQSHKKNKLGTFLSILSTFMQQIILPLLVSFLLISHYILIVSLIIISGEHFTLHIKTSCFAKDFEIKFIVTISRRNLNLFPSVLFHLKFQECLFWNLSK